MNEVMDEAYDEVFYQKPSSGDYKYDADVLTDSMEEVWKKNRGPTAEFTDSQRTEAYNMALKRVTDDMKMKRTLKEVGEKMQLSDFDVKGRKPNSKGGRVSMVKGGLAGVLGF